MSELYDRLQDPKASLTDEEALMQAFASAAAELRSWREGSLADSEFQEGTWVDEHEPDIDLEFGSMAAKGGGRGLPTTYRSGPWVVRLSLDSSGEPFAEILAGPGPASLPDLEIELVPGERSALEFPEAPDQLVLVDAEGRTWTLS
jgi:hypothetical protein